MGIARLVCGNNNREGIAKVALDQIESSLCGFSTRALQFLSQPASPDLAAYGPFCARVILEVGCAGLLGRLDAFRLLYLSEFQTQPEYEIGKRARSAFAWSGDVVSEDKPGAPLWSIDQDHTKISRALFSRHYEHVYWKPAVGKLLDFVAKRTNEQEFAEIAATNPDTYVAECRGRAQQLYSTLSKGVHWEYFTSALTLDEATIKSTVRDSLLLIGQLALTSHFVPTAYSRLFMWDAVDEYVSFRQTCQ